MNILGDLATDFRALKERLPAEDILSFDFTAEGGISFRVLFCDPVTDKELLGTLVVRPLLSYRGGRRAEDVGSKLASPELRAFSDLNELAGEVLAGNPVLLWEGMDKALVVGTKKVFLRAVMEPPTNVAVKGPREGFIEDVKVNTSLVRRRLKTGDLRIRFLKVGRRSATFVALCYLDGIAREGVVRGIEEKLGAIDIDAVPDSSYLADFLSSRPHALIKQVGTTEKPDIFCAKLAEGRVGLLVDGSPIALTLPYLFTEDLQSAEDYFVPSVRATLTRLLRLLALFAAVYLPAFYVAAQLFKLQLFPVKLLLTIAGSIRDIPLSPSLEMLLVLLMLEVLNEDYVRTSRAKGLSEQVTIIKHAFRNTLIPLVTVLSSSIPFMIGGSVVVERLFSWPGLGSLMINSINAKDYPVIMGISVIIAIVVLLSNLLVDILYAYLDPRITLD